MITIYFKNLVRSRNSRKDTSEHLVSLIAWERGVTASQQNGLNEWFHWFPHLLFLNILKQVVATF